MATDEFRNTFTPGPVVKATAKLTAKDYADSSCQYVTKAQVDHLAETTRTPGQFAAALEKIIVEELRLKDVIIEELRLKDEALKKASGAPCKTGVRRGLVLKGGTTEDSALAGAAAAAPAGKSLAYGSPHANQGVLGALELPAVVSGDSCRFITGDHPHEDTPSYTTDSWRSITRVGIFGHSCFVTPTPAAFRHRVDAEVNLKHDLKYPAMCKAVNKGVDTLSKAGSTSATWKYFLEETLMFGCVVNYVEISTRDAGKTFELLFSKVS